jgi:hypothetical protein
LVFQKQKHSPGNKCKFREKNNELFPPSGKPVISSKKACKSKRSSRIRTSMSIKELQLHDV